MNHLFGRLGDLGRVGRFGRLGKLSEPGRSADQSISQAQNQNTLQVLLMLKGVVCAKYAVHIYWHFVYDKACN